MSVVRKYATGGETPIINDYSDFIPFMEERIKKGNFTKKGEANVRKQLLLWKDALGKGLINNYVSNPDNTYEIKPGEFDTEQLIGHNKPVKTNVFGQFNLVSTPEANTWIASNFNEYKSSLGQSTSQTLQESRVFNIKNLNDAIKEKYYKDSEDFTSMWKDYLHTNFKDNKEGIYKDIMGKSKAILESYASMKPEEGITMNKIENYDNLMSAINSGDWANFKIEANKIGWNPEKLAAYGITPPTETTETTETTPVTTEEAPVVKNEGVVKPMAYAVPLVDQINVNEILPSVEEISVDPLQVQTRVDKIYQDIVDGYDIDYGILGEIKYLWNKQNLLASDQRKKLEEILTSLKEQNSETEKFQTGGKLKVKIADKTTLHNLVNSPMTGEKAMGILSTAGDVASMIPGVAGVIGGLTTTGADIAKDVMKDGFQWTDIANWNTAANLGFTALAAVGGGGLKNLLKTAKAAKTADEARDVLKIVEKIKQPSIEKTTRLLTKLTPEKATKILGKDVAQSEINAAKELLLSKPNLLQRGLTKTEKILSHPVSKIAATGALASSTIPSIKAIGKEAFTKEGKLGNISLEDVGNVSRVGALGVNKYINNKSVKAIQRQTVSNTEPAKFKFSATAKGKNLGEFTYSGELPKKDALKMKNWIYKRGSSKEKINKEFGQKIISEYNKTAPNKLDEKTVISEIEQLSPSKTIDFTLRKNPSMAEGQSSKKAQKEFDLATKIFKKQGLLSAKRPEVKPTELSTEAKEKIAKLSEQLKSTHAELTDIEKIWKNKPKKFKGYDTRVANLKSKREKIVSEIKGIKKHQKGGTILPEVDVKAKNLLNLNRDEWKNKLMPMTPKKVNDLDLALANSDLRKSLPKLGGSDLALMRKLNLGKLKEIDWANPNLLNAVGFGSTLNANANIARLQKRAALEGIVNLQGPAKEYIRSPRLISPEYTSQANKVLGAANRLGSSISDFDKRAGVMLAGQAQANDLISKGKATDLEILKDLDARRAAANAQWSAATADVVNRNKLGVAEAQKSINLIEANKVLANNAALTNLIHSFKQNKEISERKGMYKNYYNLMTSPEVKNLQNEANALAKEEQTLKTNWESKKVPLSESKSTWEKSNEAIKFGIKKKAFEDKYRDYKTRIENASLALSYLPYMAKGGSLTDKKELIRYREQLARDRKKEEDTFKTILKNNELMLRSLIKVFK